MGTGSETTIPGLTQNVAPGIDTAAGSFSQLLNAPAQDDGQAAVDQAVSNLAVTMGCTTILVTSGAAAKIVADMARPSPFKSQEKTT